MRLMAALVGLALLALPAAGTGLTVLAGQLGVYGGLLEAAQIDAYPEATTPWHFACDGHLNTARFELVVASDDPLDQFTFWSRAFGPNGVIHVPYNTTGVPPRAQGTLLAGSEVCRWFEVEARSLHSGPAVAYTVLVCEPAACPTLPE